MGISARIRNYHDSNMTERLRLKRPYYSFVTVILNFLEQSIICVYIWDTLPVSGKHIKYAKSSGL